MIPPPADSTTGDMDVSIITLFRQMEFSIKLHTVKPGWSIVKIEGSQVMISKKYCISFSKDQFCNTKQCRH